MNMNGDRIDNEGGVGIEEKNKELDEDEEECGQLLVDGKEMSIDLRVLTRTYAARMLDVSLVYSCMGDNM